MAKKKKPAPEPEAAPEAADEAPDYGPALAEAARCEQLERTARSDAGDGS